MRVELVDIHKHYGSVKANDGVGLTLEPGDIHGILGENGAGKSTLMKILSGFAAMTSGAIILNGRPATYRNPSEAARCGIGMQKEILYAALRRLGADGKSVVLVSHKLEDVEALCDRVRVLRSGRVSGTMLRPFVTQALPEIFR